MSNVIMQEIEKVATERFSDEAERAAFIEGFEKEAAINLAPIYNNPNVQQGASRALGALAIGLAGAAIAKGITSTTSAASNYVLRNKFEMALGQVMANNRIVKGSKPEKAKEYAETIFKFAPNVAADPNLLGSVLANAILGEGIDVMTIKTLTDLEGRYKENKSPGQISGIR